MARDDFSRTVVDRLAKRVGMKCSYPECRAPTSGPDAAGGVTNTGVAAHISAASPGGPRYDDMINSVARSDITNGIWLCQVHAKLIDDDELTFTPSVLRDWKDTAEHMAALEARGYAVRKASPFGALEKKLPKLIAEMRDDLSERPLVRQFIIMDRRQLYNPGRTPLFQYFYNDHEYLESAVTIMSHVGAIYSIKYNDVPRYNFREEFVAYLLGEQ